MMESVPLQIHSSVTEKINAHPILMNVAHKVEFVMRMERSTVLYVQIFDVEALAYRRTSLVTVSALLIRKRYAS